MSVIFQLFHGGQWHDAAELTFTGDEMSSKVRLTYFTHKFKWPKNLSADTLNLTEQQLHWLLSGYDVIGHQQINIENASSI